MDDAEQADFNRSSHKCPCCHSKDLKIVKDNGESTSYECKRCNAGVSCKK